MKKKVILLLALLLISLPQAVSAADNTKLIAITFDDGPSKYTENLLAGLAERHAQVTFFMQGVNAQRYPQIVQQAYAAGHQIASHTYNHPYLPKLSENELHSQLNRTAELLSQATGNSGGYMLRPPYGSYNAQVLAQIGVPAILWSVDTRDWQSRNADKVYQSIVENSRDGSIVLLHDLYPTSIDGALRGIDYLQAQGYELVTVRELLRRRGIEPAAGHTYSSAYNQGTTLPGLTVPQISYDSAADLLTIAGEGTIYYTVNGGELNVYSQPLATDSRPLEVAAFSAYNLNGGRSQTNRLLVSHLGNCFADVSAASWYYEDVDRVVAAGLLTCDNGYFYPDAPVTEQSAAILITRLLQSPLTEATVSAADNEPISRQKLALLLYQAHQLSRQPSISAGQLSADEAFKWAIAQEIFTEDTSPEAVISRAELAAVILRYTLNVH